MNMGQRVNCPENVSEINSLFSLVSKYDFYFRNSRLGGMKKKNVEIKIED